MIRKSEAVPPSVWQNPLHFIAFGFGSGTIPFAPGTWGTLMAIPFYLLLRPLSPPMYLLWVFIFTVFCIWLCDRVSREIKIHDHPGMCLDEFPGFFITLFNAPHTWRWIICGFIVFRLFDIIKPWPIGTIDRSMKGGLGMVLDDVVAGIFSL